MPAKPKLGIVALCDGVYKDALSNKIVLSGIFPGSVIASPEVKEVHLALYAELFLPDLEDHNVDLQFMLNRKRIGEARVVASTPEVRLPASLILGQLVLPVSEPAELEVRISVDGSRPIKILQKTIRH